MAARKKIRGLKRKINQFKRELSNLTLDFPDIPVDGYRELHVPCDSSEWLNSVKTPLRVRKKCFQFMIDRTKHLIDNKLQSRPDLRVLLMIDFHYWYATKIEIFSVEADYKGFSTQRDDEYSKWIELDSNLNLVDKWGLNLPEGLEIVGVLEEVKDEYLLDEEIFGGEIWFICELN